MIEGLAARWLLTVVFAAAGLRAGLPRREPAGSAQPADRASAVFCGMMCAALIAMAWLPEPGTAAWLQAALFACAALWFGLASLAGSGRACRPSLPAVLHALMAGAMIWMLISMPAGTGTASVGPARAAMASMSRTGAPASALAITVLLAVCCAAASIPWLASAIGPGLRLRDPIAASQAAMSAGMAAMLLAAL